MTIFELNRRIASLQKILNNQGRALEGDSKCQLKRAAIKSLKRKLARLSATRSRPNKPGARPARETPSFTGTSNPRGAPRKSKAAIRTDRLVGHVFFDDCPRC